MVNEEDVKMELNDLFYVQNDYGKCLNKCKEYIQLKGLQRRTIYIINLLTSQCYNQLDDMKNSVKYLNNAKKNTNNDSEKTICNWQLGCIYSDSNKKKSLKYFSRCLNYYKIIDEDFCIAELLKNLGVLYDSEVYLKQALESYRIVPNDEYVNKYLTTKDECLINCYLTLFKYYIKINNLSNIFKMINSIPESNIRKELANELQILLNEDYAV